jgi:hypothetical protein
MKRASYREAIEWIAINDSSGEDTAMDAEEVQHLVTSALVADLFEVDQFKIGKDVVRKRKQFIKEKKWKS